MAKKLIDEQNNSSPEITVLPGEGNTAPETENTSLPEKEKTETVTVTKEEESLEIKTPVTMQEKPVKEKPVTENFPPIVEAMLKAFPSHEKLYIDSQGGVYTQNSMPCIRGNAVLYKNPYYKS